jgi:hypothetical protein
MKKSSIICEAAVVFLLLSLFTFPATADPSIIISDYKLTPGEFMPGETGILSLMITNAEAVATTTETTGGASHSVSVTETNGVVIERIYISSVPDANGNQIRSILGANGYQDLGNLAAGASMKISFEMIAEENISNGYYFPKVHIDLKNDDYGNYEDVVFPIEIQVNDHPLEIIPENNPMTISMSGASDISLTLINLRESALDNIIITPHGNDNYRIQPEKLVLSQLGASSSEEIQFSIIPETIGTYQLEFDVSYENGDNSHTTTTSLTVETIDNFDVAPIIYSMPSSIEVGATEEIRLKVYNSKAESISSVIVTPHTDARVTPSQYFVGSMDADDIYSLSFDIDTTGLTQNKTYDISFTVSFKQDDTTFETPIIQSSFEVIGSNGNGDEATMAIGIGSILVIVIIFFIYRWRKKQRLKKLMAQ